MRKFYPILLLVFITVSTFAQAPQRMSYQAVIRNTSDVLVANHAVGMKISILKDATPVYVETQTPTTNANGLVAIEVGGGTPVSGTFSGIDWSSGTYFIKTETDPTGGTAYSITGTSQLLSVPYALYAKNTSSDPTNQLEINALKQRVSDLEGIVYTQLPLPTRGLIAYYPFDGNANDESGNGNNGTINGATLTNDRFGNINKAYSFDGVSNYVNVNETLGNFGLSDFSISCWIYSLNKGSEIVYIGKRSSGSRGNFWQANIDVSSRKHAWAIDNGTYIYGLYSNIDINTTSWYNVTFCREGNLWKTYINGAKDTSVMISEIQNINNTAPLTIGARFWDSTPVAFFKGKIDDIRIYNRAIAEAEIKQLYNEGGYPNTIVTDIDGNKYNTVKIGNQTWMAENLKTSKYRNGETISYVSDDTEWGGLTSGAYCWHSNDIANKDTYGALYNWYCATDSRNLCPTGWHLPSDAELTTLTDYLGGATVAGGKMKEVGSTHWLTPNTGATNESGFTALPAGYKDSSGYQPLGNNGSFWSSTSYSTDLAFVRSLGYVWNYCKVDQLNKKSGFSVRCIKDK